jgi:hypothetical protein
MTDPASNPTHEPDAFRRVTFEPAASEGARSVKRVTGRVETSDGWTLLGHGLWDPTGKLDFRSATYVHHTITSTGLVAAVDFNAVLVAVDDDLDTEGKQNLRWFYFGDWWVRSADKPG